MHGPFFGPPRRALYTQCVERFSGPTTCDFRKLILPRDHDVSMKQLSFHPKLVRVANSAHARASFNTKDSATYRVQFRLNLASFFAHLPCYSPWARPSNTPRNRSGSFSSEDGSETTRRCVRHAQTETRLKNRKRDSPNGLEFIIILIIIIIIFLC